MFETPQISVEIEPCKFPYLQSLKKFVQSYFLKGEKTLIKTCTAELSKLLWRFSESLMTIYRNGDRMKICKNDLPPIMEKLKAIMSDPVEVGDIEVSLYEPVPKPVV